MLAPFYDSLLSSLLPAGLPPLIVFSGTESFPPLPLTLLRHSVFPNLGQPVSRKITRCHRGLPFFFPPRSLFVFLVLSFEKANRLCKEFCSSLSLAFLTRYRLGPVKKLVSFRAPKFSPPSPRPLIPGPQPSSNMSSAMHGVFSVVLPSFSPVRVSEQHFTNSARSGQEVQGLAFFFFGQKVR